jgi:hypothetical protein
MLGFYGNCNQDRLNSDIAGGGVYRPLLQQVLKVALTTVFGFSTFAIILQVFYQLYCC